MASALIISIAGLSVSQQQAPGLIRACGWPVWGGRRELTAAHHRGDDLWRRKCALQRPRPGPCSARAKFPCAREIRPLALRAICFRPRFDSRHAIDQSSFRPAFNLLQRSTLWTRQQDCSVARRNIAPISFYPARRRHLECDCQTMTICLVQATSPNGENRTRAWRCMSSFVGGFGSSIFSTRLESINVLPSTIWDARLDSPPNH